MYLPLNSPWLRFGVMGLIAACLPMQLGAQEHKAAVLSEAPSAEDVPEEFLEVLAPEGIRVSRGSRTVCDIWLAKEWQLDADFEESSERLYPFTPGQLIGVLHYRRRGSDFRDQQIDSGWYSLRFGLQPIDGNHEGTSPTRDFLLMVKIEQDEVGKDWSEMDLNTASSEAAGSTHPAMVCLQQPQEAEPLAMRHNEEQDWWILHVVGKAKQGDKLVELPVDMIVVGHALE